VFFWFSLDCFVVFIFDVLV